MTGKPHGRGRRRRIDEMEPLTIEQIIKQEMTPHLKRFWGTDYENFTPALAEKQHGDGQRLMWFTPLNTRPNYYLVRVDSQLPTGSDNDSQDEVIDFIEESLIPALEEEFGSYDSEDEEEGADYSEWPALDLTIGFGWGFFDEHGRTR